MSIFDLFLERKPNSSNNHRSKFNHNVVRSRSLRLESLEERALLSAVPLSASEYADLRAQYAEFNLPENMSQVNVITLDLAQGDNLTSLQNAITQAGKSTKSDLIVIRTSDTANTLSYKTSTDVLSINIDAVSRGSVSIVGLGSKNFTINANKKCSVMTFSGSSTIVNLAGLTLANGKSDNGGGIYNTDTLEITISHCTISGNSGGGIYSNSTLTVMNSTISGNSDSHGGGITNSAGTLLVDNSIISGNSASYGGGIYNSGILTATNSTISGNSASSGGGIYNSDGTLLLVGSIVSGNTSSLTGGGAANYGKLIVTNSTISGNKASNGGGIINLSNGTLTSTNSIVCLNYAQNVSQNISGTLSTLSHNNLIDGYFTTFVNPPVFDSTGQLSNADTLDLHLRSDSTAINAGDNSAVSGITTDVEGNKRIYDGDVDIGAYEYQGDRTDVPLCYSSVVNTLNDSFDLNDDEWSLREAIYWASEYVTISFANNLKGTIQLSKGQLIVNKAIAIDGGGRIGIDADQKSRALLIDSGTYNNSVVLSGLTIQNGRTSSEGGGIYITSGVITVMNSTISGNTSTSSGGGICQYAGTFMIMNSVVSGNTAAINGGGIFKTQGTLTVTNCTISGNTATSSGTTDSRGGGIYNNSNTLKIYNSIIVLNKAGSSPDIYGSGSISGSKNLFTGTPATGSSFSYDSSKPLFVNAENGNYHLIAGSQAINKGNNLLAVDANGNALVYDLDGNGRIENGSVDIGAYEYYIGIPTPVLDPLRVSGQTVSVSWNYVTNVTTYKLEYKLSSETDWTTETVLDTSANFIGTPGMTYDVRIKALGTGGKESAYSSTKTVSLDRIQLSPPTLNQPEYDGETVLVSWSNVSNATIYQLEYQLLTETTWTTQTVSNTTATFNGVLDQMYNVRVKAIGTGSYSDSEYSSIKNVKLEAPNQGPVATNDAAEVGQIGFVLIDVLANDSDPDGDLLTISGVTQPMNGTVIVTKDDKVLYLPKTDFSGTDSFLYTISDGRGGTAAATVTVTTTVAQETVLDIPEDFKLDADGTTVTASWSQVEDASGYTFLYQIDGTDGWTTITGIQGTSTSFIGIAGTKYNAKVQANGTGEYSDSDFTEVINVMTDAAQSSDLVTPDTPTLTSEETTITATWGEVENSSAYTLRYQVDGMDGWLTIVDIQGTTTSFTGIPGTTYNVRVQANGTSEHSDSKFSEVASLTLPLPSAPITGLTLSTDLPVVGTEITTTLDPVDATVTYQWYRGTTLLEDETGSSLMVTMDEVGQTITCVVTGTGDFTGTASATTNVVPAKVLDTPDAPTLSAVETTITACWTADENASSYTLQYQIDGSEGWTTVSDIEGTSTFFVGIAGVTYNVKIQANGTGNYADSDFSEASSITLAAPLTGLTLSTDTPIVGTEITAILAPADATATYQWFADETLIEGAEDSSFVVTEDQIGQTITCVATGTGNFYGTVSASTAAIPVPVAQLDAPANFGVSVYNADVTASWTAVENASSYTLEYKPVDGDFWTSMLEIQGTTATFVGVSGTVYNVRVKANGTGDFADSDYAATITDKATGPVVAINANKVTVSWVDESPEADAVRYRVAGTEKWTLKKLKAGVTSLTFNAAIGTNYDVEVLLDQQETNVLRGTAVVLDQAKLAAVKPSITDDSFQINVTNYAAKNLAPNAKQVILTINGTMTTLDIVNQQGSAVLPGGGNVTFDNGLFTFAGMASNSQYKVQVSFSDGHSVSKVSGAVSVKTLKAPYLAPVITSVTAVSDTSIEVTWETSYGKNTETPAQKYTVQYSTDGLKWTTATTAATGNTFTIQKLKGGNNYQVRVLATKDNAFETSAPSAVMTAETLATPSVTLDKTSVTDDTFVLNVTNYATTNLASAETLNVVTDKFGTAAIVLENGTGSAAFGNGMTAEFTNGTLTFTNAPSNTALKVQISFTKADCTTNLSTALAVKTTMASYNKPVLISAIATSATTVEVAWETVYGKNSTTAAQKYTVQYSLDGSRWTNATTAATGTSFTIQNLKPKTKYLITVIATKDQWFNASEPSDSLLVTTLG